MGKLFKINKELKQDFDLVSFKFRFYPNPIQKKQLSNYFGAKNYVVNKALTSLNHSLENVDPDFVCSMGEIDWHLGFTIKQWIKTFILTRPA